MLQRVLALRQMLELELERMLELQLQRMTRQGREARRELILAREAVAA